MCVTRSIVHGSLSADGCLDPDGDRASFGGHLYTDKAPGISFVAVPVAELVRLGPPDTWEHWGDLRLWATRLATGGVALMVCVFLIGRIGEGLAPGWGGATLVTAATGTLLGSLAADNFGEVPAASLGFLILVLAWARRPGAAGLVAGVAVLFEYQTALVGLLLGAYVLLQGVRALGRYALGAAPGLLLLAAYNRAAFGSPFHLSYRYVAPTLAAQQSAGLFGIHAPAWHSLVAALVGSQGLVFVAPVLILAGAGLVLLWRSGRRAEALACWSVTLAFLVVEAGYFVPDGGDSPGPRFFVPALPFLAVGLAPAFARWRLVTSVCAAASVLASTAVLLTWPAHVNAVLPARDWTIWHSLADLAANGMSSQLILWKQQTFLDWLGIHRLAGDVLVLAAALVALGFGLYEGLASSRRDEVHAALIPDNP